MKTRNIELTLKKAKEWYNRGGELKEVALQAYTKEELSDIKPTTWEEYCECPVNHDDTYYINAFGEIMDTKGSPRYSQRFNIYPSKEYAEAFVAMMKLINLRHVWIGEWKPEDSEYYYMFFMQDNRVVYDVNCEHDVHPLSFPTRDMIIRFHACFHQLLEEAKPLL